MRRLTELVLACFVAGYGLMAMAATNVYSLAYTPASAANPLKGFMPYAGSYSTFPYSMEWGYLPLRSLMTGPTNFVWSKLDTLLESVAARGHHTVFRVYLDYPGQSTGIPQYLLDAGLGTFSYDDYGNKGRSLCPDYKDPLLHAAMTNFIAALGARYDGDPRIGFVEVGLLGYWGEWHTYPEEWWFAPLAVQDLVLAAYTNAFPRTHLLVRYPDVIGHANPAALPIGYHDDSFAYATIAPPSYNFMGRMASTGQTNKWLAHPIGGEVRPEVQSCMWNTADSNCVPAGQSYSNCVALTHASWMLNQGVFSPGLTGEQKTRALAGARQLGYELYVSNAVVVDPRASGPLKVSLSLFNTGVAPFYYDWPVQVGVLNSNKVLLKFWTAAWKLSSLAPGTNLVWAFSKTNHGLPLGTFKLVVRVLNPLTNGVTLAFANEAQDADLSGWLTVGQFSVLADRDPPTLRASTSGSASLRLLVANAVPGAWTILGADNPSLDWVSLLTTNTTTSQWDFSEPISAPMRFYRIRGAQQTTRSHAPPVRATSE